MSKNEIESKLGPIQESLTDVVWTTDRRVYLLCEGESSFAVNKFLYEELGLRFAIATAMDCADHFEVLYHFSDDAVGCVVTTKAFIRDYAHPAVESIGQFLPGAEWIEREMHDEFGIEFVNHPDMRRLVLADDWPDGEYPLRKKART